jgi:bifunctional non-homologous end joining protein LigD
VQRDRPELFTTPRAVSKRQKGRVYFDWVQNGKVQDHRRAVCAARLSRRARGHAAGLGRSAAGADPGQFNIYNAPERFAKVGDLFAGVLKKPQKLEEPQKLEKLQKLP